MEQTYYVLLQYNDARNNYEPGTVIGLFSKHNFAYNVMENCYQKFLKGVLDDIETYPDCPDTSTFHISKFDASIQTSESEPDTYNWEIIEAKVITTQEEMKKLMSNVCPESEGLDNAQGAY